MANLQRARNAVGAAMNALTLVQPRSEEVSNALEQLRDALEAIDEEQVAQPLVEPPITPTEQELMERRLGKTQAAKPESLLGNKRSEF